MARKCIDTDGLAKKSGVSKYTLYAFRNSQRNPSTKTVGKIAKALDVDVTDIIE
jgi:transcriptional regulator with XRE-family HTH domain